MLSPYSEAMSPGLFRNGKDLNVHPEDTSKASQPIDIRHLRAQQSPSTWVKTNAASGYTSPIIQNFSLALAKAGQWRLCLNLSVVLSHADILGFACCCRWFICSSICVNNTWVKDTWVFLCHKENTSITACWLSLEFQPVNPNKQGKHCKHKTTAYQLALLHCSPPQNSADIYDHCCKSPSKPSSGLPCRLSNALSNALLFTELITK